MILFVVHVGLDRARGTALTAFITLIAAIKKTSLGLTAHATRFATTLTYCPRSGGAGVFGAVWKYAGVRCSGKTLVVL